MPRKNDRISDDERREFQDAMQDTDFENHSTEADDSPEFHSSDQIFEPQHWLTSDDKIQFHREGLQSKLLSRLKQGKLSIESTLDLHGLRALEAKLAFDTFLHHATIDSLRFLCIIHGKSMSKGQHGGESVAILKSYVSEWLLNDARILAAYSAPPSKGGTGAVLVILKT